MEKFWYRNLQIFCTWDSEDACKTVDCIWLTIGSMSALGPVTKPRRMPELSTLERESNRRTLPSTSIERKLGMRSYFWRKRFSIAKFLLVLHLNYLGKLEEIVGIVLENDQIKIPSNLVNFLFPIHRNGGTGRIGSNRIDVQELFG